MNTTAFLTILMVLIVVRMSVCLSLCLSACLSVCLPVCLSLCLSVCLSVCMCSFKKMCLFIIQKVVWAPGQYKILLVINKFENRGGRCADEACHRGQGCCQSSSCAVTSCNYTFSVCRRIPPRPNNNLPTINNLVCPPTSFRKQKFGSLLERYGSRKKFVFFGINLVSEREYIIYIYNI